MDQNPMPGSITPVAYATYKNEILTTPAYTDMCFGYFDAGKLCLSTLSYINKSCPATIGQNPTSINNICAISSGSGSDPCNGYTRSPLFYTESDMSMTLIGFYSFGIGQCTLGSTRSFGAIKAYTSVSACND